MARTIRLKHTLYTLPEYVEYFYDGQAVVKNGVIELPADNPTWLQRAWIVGYRLDPETGKEIADWRTLLVDESAESAGEKSASPTRRR